MDVAIHRPAIIVEILISKLKNYQKSVLLGTW